MKIITELKQANMLLQSYVGATFQVAMYNESLKRIAIRLSLHDEQHVLYLIGISCEKMNGAFCFANANISISQEFVKNKNASVTVISDKNSGFKLYTSGGFSLAQGFESEFGTSFSNFILHK